MEKPKSIVPGSLELFAALIDQFPLATREDLEWTVSVLRGRPEWARALEHARRQARELGMTLPEPREAAHFAEPLRN
jgi:hypothetical protein